MVIIKCFDNLTFTLPPVTRIKYKLYTNELYLYLIFLVSILTTTIHMVRLRIID